VMTEGPDAWPPARPEPTGDPAVDAAVESLDSLDEAPVSEHIAVFESAHVRLRAALADAGDESAGS